MIVSMSIWKKQLSVNWKLAIMLPTELQIGMSRVRVPGRVLRHFYFSAEYKLILDQVLICKQRFFFT